MNITLEKLIYYFNDVTIKPENFISNELDQSEEIKTFLKSSYDFAKDEEEKSQKTDALPELIIEEFDLEQIWQQLELQNEQLLSKSLANVSKLVVRKEHLLFDELIKEEEPPDNKAEQSEEDQILDNLKDSQTSDSESEGSVNNDDKVEEESESDDTVEDEKPDQRVNFGKGSVVDDEFFKLNEMEEFLRAEEKAADKEPNEDSGNESKEDEEIDYFNADNDNDGVDDEENSREKNPRYKDFFQSTDTEKKPKRNKFLEDVDEAENESPVEVKSSYEVRQERLKKKIKVIEDIALAERPWQLQGEITAEKRPQNSLLEEVVEFDLTSRPAPVITEKTTLQLEDIILQRIKDKAFDSVERKERPVDNPLEYKKRLVLDQEKSKESLARIYEKEYLQQVEAAAGTEQDKEVEDPELHKEIRKMMRTLFGQLDALSNYHFTPKPAAPELRIISNLPAINMEEVAPVAATDATLLAPEEVKKRIKGDIIGKSERTDADKNRERRKKKAKQQIHAKRKTRLDQSSKTNPGLGNKYSKEKVKKQLQDIVKDKNIDKMDESTGSKAVKSSTAFFRQLEDEVKSQIKVKAQGKRKKEVRGISAKKMKL